MPLQEFLYTFFADLRGGEFIELRVLSPDRFPEVRFCSSVSEAVGQVEAKADEWTKANVYFGVCPRSEKRGTTEAIKRVPTLWADVDAKDPPFLGDKEKALSSLMAFPLKPTVIVDSGHGYHGYWILKDPVDVSSPEGVAAVKSRLKRLALTINGDVSVADIARVMRLPGTFNVKDPANPLPVKVVRFEP